MAIRRSPYDCILAIAPWCVALCMGCADRHLYSMAFYNGTTQRLNGVQYVDSPEFVSGGVMDPGIDKSCTVSGPVQPTATIQWRTADGVMHEQSVALCSVVPNPDHFRGTVFFEITDDGVHVVPWTEDQWEKTHKRLPWGPSSYDKPVPHEKSGPS